MLTETEKERVAFICLGYMRTLAGVEPISLTKSREALIDDVIRIQKSRGYNAPPREAIEQVDVDEIVFSLLPQKIAKPEDVQTFLREFNDLSRLSELRSCQSRRMGILARAFKEIHLSITGINGEWYLGVER